LTPLVRFGSMGNLISLIATLTKKFQEFRGQ